MWAEIPREIVLAKSLHVGETAAEIAHQRQPPRPTLERDIRPHLAFSAKCVKEVNRVFVERRISFGVNQAAKSRSGYHLWSLADRPKFLRFVATSRSCFWVSLEYATLALGNSFLQLRSAKFMALLDFSTVNTVFLRHRTKWDGVRRSEKSETDFLRSKKEGEA